MRYTISHRGTPVAAIADAGNPEQLGSVAVELLPAFDGLRPLARAMWRDQQALGRERLPQASLESLAGDLELRDGNGAWLPTKRIELWVTGPQTAAAFIDLDHSFAAVPAQLPRPVRDPGSAAPEG